MKSSVVVLVFCAGAAFAVAGLNVMDPSETDAATAPAATASFDADAPVDDRIAALERAVSEERLARQLLQEELFYLTGELERLADPGDGVPRSAAGATETGVAAESPADPRPGRRPRGDTRDRRERLVDAGFLPAQADWIIRREQELQMEALQARFDAERNGEPVDWMANRTMASDTLRAELGDAGYEQYLAASGRSTNISVSSVIESSPAQSAGLLPGDEIVRYDGERVFSMTDLTRQTMTGDPGEAVVVDIMRDGNLMQVVMPRGPVGITGGRRRY